MERRGSRLSRRQFVVGASGAGLGLVAGCGRLPWQETAQASRTARFARIGCLLAATPDAQAERLQAFQQGLATYGYLEGRDITLEVRYANGALDRMPALAAELVALPVAVIVTGATAFAEVVRQVTSTIPIVVAGSGGDLVNSGLAASLAHPGGNVTGLSIPTELEGKRLQLLTQTASGISRVAVLRDASASEQFQALAHTTKQSFYEGFARVLGIQLQVLNVGSPEDIESAFAAATEDRAEGLWVPTTPLIAIQRQRIIALAAKHRLPAVYGRREYVEDGGLMSYEPRITGLWQRAAYYVDRILKGAHPADLPVEQPMVFDFVVNMKTARDLGITFPNEILLQVTEVIE